MVSGIPGEWQDDARPPAVALERGADGRSKDELHDNVENDDKGGKVVRPHHPGWDG